jgi:hypothetical protein
MAAQQTSVHRSMDWIAKQPQAGTAIDGKALVAVLMGPRAGGRRFTGLRSYLRYAVIRSLKESPGGRMGDHSERMERGRESDQERKAHDGHAPAPAAGHSPARSPVPSRHVKLQRITCLTGNLYPAALISEPVKGQPSTRRRTRATIQNPGNEPRQVRFP